MDKIIEQFNRDFAHWGIRFPRDAVEERGRGRIVKARWAIWFRFGVDPRGEYLDYYSAHRRTDDRHTRVYEDGHVEILPTTNPYFRDTYDPDNDVGIKAKICAKNQKIAAMLADKGFGPSGEEPGAIQVSRFLHVWPNKDEAPAQPDEGREGSVMDLGPGTYIAESQKEFLRREIYSLTYTSAFGHARIYADNVKDSEKESVREALIQKLEYICADYSERTVKDDVHCDRIVWLADSLSTHRSSGSLCAGRFRIGVAQKALNLFLKYLWCLGDVAEPPHCPFDRTIIQVLPGCRDISWTKFDDMVTYKRLVMAVKAKAKPLTPAEWELRFFNLR